MKIKQGDKVRIAENRKVRTVAQFIVLETEVSEDTLNALLYETERSGRKSKKDDLGRAPTNWWNMSDNDYYHWELETPTGWKLFQILDTAEIKG